jgi:HAD superfamily hydrolase (TIGR01509 family)
MIKNVLFDMGGVVFLQDSAEAYRRFQEYGIDSSHYMGDYGQKDFFLDVETGIISGEEFCRKMAQASGREHISWKEAQYCWLGFIKSVPVDRLHFLTRLREHYHVCLASNTNPFIMDFTRSNLFSEDGKPITSYFDRLFCSYEIKHYKPHADFYQYILQADNMRPEECVYLDDSAKNIAAAEQLGIHGFLVAPDEDWTGRLAALLGMR